MLFGKTCQCHWSTKLQPQWNINWLFMSDVVTFFCWAFMWVSILAASRSRLGHWLYFNVNRPLLFMYRPVWLLLNGNWILLFCKGKTALEARKVSLDVMKYLPVSLLFLLFILFACYIVTCPPSAALQTLFCCLVVFNPSLCYYMHYKNCLNCNVNCITVSCMFNIFVLLFPHHLFQLLGELLNEGQPLSVGVSAESGQGGQWLAYIAHLVKETSVNDVTVVPVGISYDWPPKTSMPVGVKMHVCKHTNKRIFKDICSVWRSKYMNVWIYSKVSRWRMEK